MKNGKKLPVAERALIKRVNRCLSESGRKLMKNHPARSKKGKRRLTQREIEFGTYFVVKVGGDRLEYENVVERDINLEDFARDLGALSAFEFLEIEKTYGQK